MVAALCATTALVTATDTDSSVTKTALEFLGQRESKIFTCWGARQEILRTCCHGVTLVEYILAARFTPEWIGLRFRAGVRNYLIHWDSSYADV